MTTTGASSKQQLVVNPEYANLVPKISKAQYKSIRQDIGENGQHVPIIINRKGEILDGHTRFSINQELVKETRTELCPEMYEDPLFAKQFIININRNRRQLNAFQRIELQYKLEPIEAELAKRRQLKLAGTRPNKQTLSKNLPKVGIDFDPESETLGRVIDIAAAKAHVSSETYRRGRELIRKESPEIIEKLRTEKLKIHKVYMRRVKQEKRQQLLEESRINNRELPYGCKLLLGDCIEVSKQIPDNSIDLIFTDPPYDKASLYVYEYLGKIAMRVLKSGASLITFFGQYSLPQILNIMIDSGLKYNWIGYVRHTGPTRSMHDNHSIVFGKPLLWFFKGDKLSGDYVSDFIESKPPNKALDDWAQSPVEAEHYIWPLTVENQIVFDPFMGSGTFGIAALKLKRQFIGIDKTPKRFEVAKSNLERISQSEKELSA